MSESLIQFISVSLAQIYFDCQGPYTNIVTFTSLQKPKACDNKWYRKEKKSVKKVFEKLKQAVMQKFYGFCIVPYQTKVHKPELVACRLYVT